MQQITGRYHIYFVVFLSDASVPLRNILGRGIGLTRWTHTLMLGSTLNWQKSTLRVSRAMTNQTQSPPLLHPNNPTLLPHDTRPLHPSLNTVILGRYLWEMSLTVFVRRDLLSHVSQVRRGTLACGVAGVAGNKVPLVQRAVTLLCFNASVITEMMLCIHADSGE